VSRIAVYLFFVSLALWLAFCAREPAAEQAGDGPWRNLADSVGFVGMAVCASCHLDVHATFIHTGMGRSFGLASAGRSDARFGAHALVYDTARNFYYYPYLADSSFYIREFRLGGSGDTLYSRTEKVAYIVGSGHHTNSHIIDINGYIYQAPITYYTQQQRWDLAPGYADFNERFERLLTEECITCHNHYPEQVAGGLNKYSAMPGGIECERCHGAGALHAREKLAGIRVDTAAGPDYSIVNPRRLPRDLQMDLCQRCHLQGLAVLEEGKTFFDFRPGMPLNEVVNVYLPRFTNSHEKFIMASQADRLRMSDCFRESDMTCITCHNPHQSVTTLQEGHFNRVCGQCHGAGDGRRECSAPAHERRAANNDCVHCHMPTSGSADIPHVNITDHYISKTNTRDRPEATGSRNGQARFLGLEVLTKEKASGLDLARAYLALYDKYVGEAYILDSAGHYLGQVKEQSPLHFRTRVHYAFARQDHAALQRLAAGRDPGAEGDAWTAYRLGEGFMGLGRAPEAYPWIDRAVRLMPYHLDFLEKQGSALVDLQRLEEAETVFNKVLRENPKRKLALLNLGYLEALRGRFNGALDFYDRALALDPDYEQALINKAAILLLLKKHKEARALLMRVVQLNPANVQAVEALAQFPK
jgi:hypothetical protein